MWRSVKGNRGIINKTHNKKRENLMRRANSQIRKQILFARVRELVSIVKGVDILGISVGFCIQRRGLKIGKVRKLQLYVMMKMRQWNVLINLMKS